MKGKIPLAPERHVFSIPRPGRVKQYLNARFHTPEIEPEYIRNILDSYGLEMTRPLENMPLGWRNSNLVVYVSSGKKVLKIYRDKWPLQSIIHEHSILNRLEKLNFPSPRPVCNLKGETVVHKYGNNFALFDYINGFNYSTSYILRSHQDVLIAKAGRTLAALHRQLTRFQPESQHHLGFRAFSDERIRDLSWHLNQLTILREKSTALEDVSAKKDADWLIERSKFISDQLCQLDETLSSVCLPRLVIHGDYGIHNLLFQKDGSVTVHDFELSRVEWRLVDLVTVLSRLDYRKCRVFMSAYQEAYSLTPEEWQYLPLVWQYYRLRGSVQSWNNYFEVGNRSRLVTARERVIEAEQVPAYKTWLWKLREFPGESQPLKAARVVMVARLFHPWIGGTERQAHKLALKLLEKQTPVEIVTGWWFRGTSRTEIINGVSVFRNFTFWEFLGIKGLRKFGGYIYILSLLLYLWRRRDDYDIIHVHGLNYHTFTAVLAGRWFKKKVISKLANSARASDIENMRQDKQLAFSKYMLPIALKCDRFIALNSTVTQELKMVGVPNQKIIPLPNGVEVDGIVPKSNYLLQDPIRLIYVGRLHQQKGLDTLLNAISCLSIDSLSLQLLGDGPIKMDLMDLVEKLGISEKVSFLGESDRVNEFLEQADIFVLPSRAEGLSNALLEAMTYGLPVLVSDVPGNRDVIEHGKNGLLFSVDDFNSLAKNLRLMLNKLDLREKLGGKARETIEKHYSMGFVADQYAGLYQDLLTDSKQLNLSPVGIDKSRIHHEES